MKKDIILAMLLVLTSCVRNRVTYANGFLEEQIKGVLQNTSTLNLHIFDEDENGESTLTYCSAIDKCIDDALANYFTALPVNDSDDDTQEFRDMIRFRYNVNNAEIIDLLTYVSINLSQELDESFSNDQISMIIELEDVSLHFDQLDHVKIISNSNSVDDIAGVYSCDGISEKVNAFIFDQYILTDQIYESFINIVKE